MRYISLALVLAGCSSAADVPERSTEEQAQIADSKIVVDVKERMLDDGVPGHHRVRVECVTGVVTLRGQVPSKEASAAAEASARAVRGVKDVLNRMTVGP